MQNQFDKARLPLEHLVRANTTQNGKHLAGKWLSLLSHQHLPTTHYTASIK
ncbi:hypothetical protein [Tumebacillus algifaecis]|uniref:hypothetical protein n=1 Tax=Tumebacillus algifaecis TaxID=1214604 RepID=UPI0012FD4361|nr:hypothetical protein [Tumebacillus algifaecis]